MFLVDINVFLYKKKKIGLNFILLIFFNYLFVLF